MDSGEEEGKFQLQLDICGDISAETHIVPHVLPYYPSRDRLLVQNNLRKVWALVESPARGRCWTQLKCLSQSMKTYHGPEKKPYAGRNSPGP
ncbi:hypothetical protein SRHO_G00148520 [Serrasalmus rhombeus]